MRVNREALKLHVVYKKLLQIKRELLSLLQVTWDRKLYRFHFIYHRSCAMMLSISANCLVWQHQSGCGWPPLSLGFTLGVGGWPGFQALRNVWSSSLFKLEKCETIPNYLMLSTKFSHAVCMVTIGRFRLIDMNTIILINYGQSTSMLVTWLVLNEENFEIFL